MTEAASTPDRIRAAALLEFSEHGLAGARVDRIAELSGANKERIYRYFGNKEKLFDAVLEAELASLFERVPFRGAGAQAIVDYAGDVFDFYRREPALARLTVWEGLERGAEADADRQAHCTRHVEAMRELDPRLGDTEARQLLLTITTLAASWPVTVPLTSGVLGTPAAPDARREAILATVRAILG